MPLVNTKKMFDAAMKGGFAVGAFNVNNMEIIQGIIWAAKEKKAPLILQISRGAREYANMAYLKALIDVAVSEAPELPIAVHLDHGTEAVSIDCIAEGYNSVMYDGSHDSLEDNIAVSKKVADAAHAVSPYITVEAELGMLGGIEEDVVGVAEEDVHNFLTDVDEAEQFVKESGVDSLAVAIGTSHGAFKFSKEPKLAFDRLEELGERLPNFPLVMHGSSSVPKEFIDKINSFAVLESSNKKMLQTALDKGWTQMPGSMGVPEAAISKAVKMNVCKVNIDTDLRLALTASILEAWANCNKACLEWIEGGCEGRQPEFKFDPRKYLGPGREAIQKMVSHKMDVLGCTGKAEACL
jgi:fructose-bisphosphate aldolase, class II